MGFTKYFNLAIIKAVAWYDSLNSLFLHDNLIRGYKMNYFSLRMTHYSKIQGIITAKTHFRSSNVTKGHFYQFKSLWTSRKQLVIIPIKCLFCLVMIIQHILVYSKIHDATKIKGHPRDKTIYIVPIILTSWKL